MGRFESVKILDELIILSQDRIYDLPAQDCIIVGTSKNENKVLAENLNNLCSDLGLYNSPNIKKMVCPYS